MPGFTRTLLALCLLLTAITSAAEAPTFDQLLAMDLSELTRIPVLTASRHEQQLWQAPAIVSVLDGDSLRHQGYRSVAEALTQLPGFFMVDDGVGQYAVVRGIGNHILDLAHGTAFDSWAAIVLRISCATGRPGGSS